MPHQDSPDSTISVALGEYDTDWQDPKLSLSRAEQVVARAKQNGAQFVVLPEMCTTGFTMDPATHAEAAGAASDYALAKIAARYGVYVLAGVSRDDAGTFYNAAVLFDPLGRTVTEYRKRRLFRFASETDAYCAGRKPTIVSVAGVRIAIFICFDLRFPELFREVARDVDACAIVANWPRARRHHWDSLLIARAIENQCYVIGVNRVGTADNLDYNGGSVLIGPTGEIVARAAQSPDVAVALIETRVVRESRRACPFLDELRMDDIDWSPL